MKEINTNGKIEYDAFISYRHVPADINIAKEIQKRLENYRIPKELSKKLGKQKIGRIFRDKEELPITSDLTSNIEQALNNSTFLIVICSPDTKKSVWVQREIDFFLKTHSRRNILTVLVSGEPSEVIPQTLLEEEYYNPDTDSKEIRLVEPLSCDYRMAVYKARREELPRLAAAVLGCSYDELINRQRQYRTRRAVTLMASALALVSMFLAFAINRAVTISKQAERIEKQSGEIKSQSKEIERQAESIYEEYQKALINQSLYLSAESLQKVEEGDVNTAILLALEAFPKVDDDRPLIPEAELALTRALNCYCPGGGGFGYKGVDRVIRNRYYGNGKIADFYLDKDKSHIILADETGLITVKDVNTGDAVSTIEIGGDFSTYLNISNQIIITEDNNILVVTPDSGIECYELTSGKCIWSIEPGEGRIDAKYIADTNELWVVNESLSFNSDDDHDKAVCEIRVISADTGKLSKTVEFDVTRGAGDKGLRTVEILNDGVAGDNHFVLINVGLMFSADTDTPDRLYIYDVTDDTCKFIKYKGDKIKDSLILPNGDVAILSQTSHVTNQKDNLWLRCFDIKTLREKWRIETDFDPLFGGQPRIIDLDNGTMLYAVYDKVMYVDCDTGVILSEKSIKTAGKLLDVFELDDKLRFTTNDGEMAVLYRDYNQNTEGSIKTNKISANDESFKKSEYDDDLFGFYMLAYGADCVELAANNRNDDSYTVVDEIGGNITNTIIDGDFAYAYLYGGKVVKLDMSTNRVAWKNTLPKVKERDSDKDIFDLTKGNSEAISGGVFLSSDKTRLVVIYSDGVRYIDTQNGKCTDVVFEKESEIGSLWRGAKDYTFAEDKIIFINTVFEEKKYKLKIITYNTLDDTYSCHEMDDPKNIGGIRYLGGKIYLIKLSEDIAFIEGDEIKYLDTDLFFDSSNDLFTLYGDESETIIAAAGTKVELYDTEGNKKGKITLTSAVSGATFSEDGKSLFVLDEAGTLGVYNLDGKKVKERNMPEIPGNRVFEKVKWYFEGEEMIIQVNNTFHVLECDGLKKKSEAFFGDWYFGNKIYGVCYYSDNASTVLISYDMYTSEKLREKALEISKDYVISNPERYGLE